MSKAAMALFRGNSFYIFALVQRKKIALHNYFKLVLCAAGVSVLSILLIYALKQLTEHTEHFIFNKVRDYNHPLLFIFLPTIGITAIYFTRKYLFKGRKNKGFAEIYNTLDKRKEHLPAYKIPAHFINGFLTVIFGGSTGVEVSSVVATATIGNQVYKQEFSARVYKRELICAGAAASIAVLFGSPLAGFLFAIEVISKKVNATIVLSCATSSVIAWLFITLFGSRALMPFSAPDWAWRVFPLFILLSLLSSLLSVYFTYVVTRLKKFFGNINNNFIRVNLGALAVGGMLCLFPALYGDSYNGLRQIIMTPTVPTLSLIFLVLLKPLAASLTLGAGGDGGVFAPSIVAGAFLGLLFASLCNSWFHTNLIPINFAMIGAASALSGAIFAPFTAIILGCSFLPNGYHLFLPLLFSCFAAKIFAQKLLPYNVYTYDFYQADKRRKASEKNKCSKLPDR